MLDLLDKLFSDPAFGEGFVTALLWTLLIGGAMGAWNYLTKRATRMFDATRMPATNPGPSGCQIVVDSLVAIAVLVLIAIIVFVVFFSGDA